MTWIQILVIVLLTAELTLTCAWHGKPRKPHDSVGKFVGIAIWVTLLYLGGFWK